MLPLSDVDVRYSTYGETIYFLSQIVETLSVIALTSKEMMVLLMDASEVGTSNWYNNLCACQGKPPLASIKQEVGKKKKL